MWQRIVSMHVLWTRVLFAILWAEKVTGGRPILESCSILLHVTEYSKVGLEHGCAKIKDSCGALVSSKILPGADCQGQLRAHRLLSRRNTEGETIQLKNSPPRDFTLLQDPRPCCSAAGMSIIRRPESLAGPCDVTPATIGKPGGIVRCMVAGRFNG